jgi:hypothetical protein
MPSPLYPYVSHWALEKLGWTKEGIPRAGMEPSIGKGKSGLGQGDRGKTGSSAVGALPQGE